MNSPQPPPRPPAPWPLRALRELARALADVGGLARGQVVQRVGGPARARVITTYAAVLALAGADSATIGAAAPQLERALHIGNTALGLLSSAGLLSGALFVIPVGMAVDRVRRMPMLSISIVLWSIASLASAFAGSYSTLLLTRLALGAVTATAGPAIASLTGDYFPARERGQVYSYILAGETTGAALGFIIGGSIASAISWRLSFVLLALPGFWVARTLWRTIPEPARGGQSYLEPGEHDLEEALAKAAARARWVPEDPSEAPTHVLELAREAVRRSGIEPDEQLVLHRDPRGLSIGQAIRYILSIRTYALLVIASSLGYFFFSGLQTFAIVFMRGHYGISQAAAELMVASLVIAAIIGTLISGRLTDAMLRRGVLEARIWVPAACYLLAAAVLVPGFLGAGLTPALWFDLVGTALIAAANPPLDAARLDIMPAGLWGRAESTRGLVRSLAQALAPLIFGGVAELIAGIAPQQAPIGTHPGVISPASATGLEVTFLVMLASLAAAGVFLARARQSYPRDVATAAASRQGTGTTQTHDLHGR